MTLGYFSIRTATAMTIAASVISPAGQTCSARGYYTRADAPGAGRSRAGMARREFGARPDRTGIPLGRLWESGDHLIKYLDGMRGIYESIRARRFSGGNAIIYMAAEFFTCEARRFFAL